MERQAPFLKSVLREADNHKRQQLLRMANADQINAISELVMNTIRGTVPRSRHTITLLKPHAQSLRAMAKPCRLRKTHLAYFVVVRATSVFPSLFVKKKSLCALNLPSTTTTFQHFLMTSNPRVFSCHLLLAN